MPNLDLPAIRAMNAKPDEDCPGYWQRTVAALCDEVERLRKTDSERRQVASALFGGLLTPDELAGDYVVRKVNYDLDAIRRIADSGLPVPPWLVRSLCDRVERLERIAEAAHAWADAIDRCDGIAAAEQTLRGALEELKSWISRA